MLVSEYACRECNNRRFPNERALHAHQTRSHNRAPFVKLYVSITGRTRNVPVHCYTCRRTFANSGDYRNHIKNDH